MSETKNKFPSEAQIQADFFSWLALNEKRFPELGLFYAIPNGSHKSPAARGLFQRTGLKAGVPDVHLPVYGISGKNIPGVHCIGLFIEFKAKRGVLSPLQKSWIERLLLRGHRVEICRSWIEAANITIEYLGLPIKPLDR